MATYNGAKHLPQQLDSFLAQTRLPDELVVSDDRSTDGTPELIEAFGARAPFEVRMVRNLANVGVDRNFDRALAMCTGDVVLLSDQDDAWFPDKIATVANRFAENPRLQLIANDQIITDGELNPSSFTTLHNFRKAFGTDAAFGNGCCLSFRRSWLQFILPVPGDTFNYDLWINSLAVLLKVRAVIDRPLQYYRRHGGNASQSLAFETRDVSRRDYHAQDLGEDHRDLWSRQIGNVTVFRDRINQRREQLLGIVEPAAIEEALGELQSRGDALELRTRIRSASLLQRVPLVVRLLASGGYRHFSGLKSAARDLVR
ncbi:MAG TPA: glycosyltransferase [Sphingomonadaceae bacterium]|nr:glycosyltransferase [Sphingomonadaceae bacterium]